MVETPARTAAARPSGSSTRQSIPAKKCEL